jgi:hypothetical protein
MRTHLQLKQAYEKMTDSRIRMISLSILASFSVLLSGAAETQASSVEPRPLSISSGIAEPSDSLAPFQNPAGLIHNNAPALSAWAGIDNDSLKNPETSAGFYTGSPNFGLGAGLLRQNTSAGTTSAFASLSVNANGIDTALGVSAQKVIAGGTSTAWNAGLLLGTHQRIRAGLIARDFLNPNHGWGAGISFDILPAISLVTDATVDRNFENIWLSPGIGFRTPGFGLSASYGLPLHASSIRSPAIQDGLGAGANLNLNPDFSLFAYYRQLNRYMVGLTLRF